jgi:Zn-finger nucleic acid-binding protein
MICPACKTDMIVVEYNKVELDYCTNCHGVWFDSGELELLLKSMSLDTPNLLITNILNSPEASSSEKKRKCPICNQKMKKTTVGEHPEILVDICRQKDGLWFDGGEVAQLLRQLAANPPGKKDSQQQITSFLGEVFKARG